MNATTASSERDDDGCEMTKTKRRTTPMYRSIHRIPPVSRALQRISKPHNERRAEDSDSDSCTHLFPDKVFLLRQPHPELGLEFLLQRLDGGFLQVRPAKDGWQVRHDVALESIHPRRRSIRWFVRSSRSGDPPRGDALVGRSCASPT